jgi:hypothetical protein
LNRIKHTLSYNTQINGSLKQRVTIQRLVAYQRVGCWLAAFLDSAKRKQAVVVEGRISSLSPVISGVPQGTVLGPVLFLLHISNIAKDVSQSTTTTSYVDDTRVTRSIAGQEDCQALQDDLDHIYKWAEEVNMIFNSDKFECLCYWPRRTKPDFTYKSPDGSVILERDHLQRPGSGNVK